MASQSEIDNQLVEQKNKLLGQVNTEDLAKWEQVISTLHVLTEMWISQGYGYKVNEILSRIQVRAGERIEELPKQERVLRRKLNSIRNMCEINRVRYEDLI